MQIEEGFPYHKSTHYELGFSQQRNTEKKRRAALCLLATLAHCVLWCIGIARKETVQAKRSRINSSSKKALYSTIFLARLLIDQKHFRLPGKEPTASLHKIKVNAQRILCC
ncbi:MAG: hypothetical protein ACI945_001807 [Pseudohongiellaceae bacterium]|jgi:hypothetical protein